MDECVLDTLRDLNILIKKRLFILGKKNGIGVPPSPLQVRIFMYIYESKDKEVSQALLAQELKVSKVSISEAVSKMVSNGNIKVITSSSDARKNVITITDQGIEIMNKMRCSFDILKHEILAGISDEELETFFGVMQHMKENMREDNYV